MTHIHNWVLISFGYSLVARTFILRGYCHACGLREELVLDDELSEEAAKLVDELSENYDFINCKSTHPQRVTYYAKLRKITSVNGRRSLPGIKHFARDHLTKD